MPIRIFGGFPSAALAEKLAKRVRDGRVLWLLEEMGRRSDVELVHMDLSSGIHKKEPYLSINPLGRIPALTDGDFKLFESSAVCLYLAHQWRNEVFDPGTPRSFHDLQWLSVVQTSVEPYAQNVMIYTHFWADEPLAAEMRKNNRKALESVFRVLSEKLQQSPFLTGDKIGISDIFLHTCLGFFDAESEPLFLEFPKLKEWHLAQTQRPAWAKAYAHNGLPLQPA